MSDMSAKSVRFKSYAKINIGLSVSPPRSDGYHSISTLFQTVNLFDIIELDFPVKDISVQCSDDRIPVGEENLAVQAALKFIECSGLDGAFRLNIEKNIPAGAGLGGGSSNAASVLLALNHMAEDVLSFQTVHDIALSIGADVPFFLRGGLMLGRGIGEKLRPLKDFPMENILLVFPDVISLTGEVYKSYDLLLTEGINNITMNSFYDSPVPGFDLYSLLVNDLEEAALSGNNKLRTVRSVLDETDFVFSMMSGSGSVFYAVYENKEALLSAGEKVDSLSFVRSVECRTVGREEYSGNFAF